MKEKMIVVIGYTTIDININPKKKSVLPGGAAYFVAISASLFEKEIGLVTRVGGDFNSKFLFSRVLEKGIKVIRNGKTLKSIQTYHSLNDLTDRTIDWEWGVAPSLTAKDIPAYWLMTARWIHVATMPPKHQAKFVKFLKDKAPHAKLSIDTDLVFLKDKKLIKIVKENFAQADLVFVNRREYDLLKPILNRLTQVVVKLDAFGAKYMEKGKTIYQVKAKKVKVKEVTGAGDIFAGAFIANQYLGRPTKKCLKIATDLATKSVAQEGVNHLFI